MTWPLQLTRGVWDRLAKKQGAQGEAEHEDDLEDKEEEEADEVEGYDVKAERGTPTPPARRSRAAELRAQRTKGKGASGDATPSISTAENTEAEDDSASAPSGTETRRKKVGGGKAAAARRRKMGTKK